MAKGCLLSAVRVTTSLLLLLSILQLLSPIFVRDIGWPGIITSACCAVFFGVGIVGVVVESFCAVLLAAVVSIGAIGFALTSGHQPMGGIFLLAMTTLVLFVLVVMLARYNPPPELSPSSSQRFGSIRTTEPGAEVIETTKINMNSASTGSRVRDRIMI